MNANTVIADYKNERHAKDIVLLLNHYAADPAGGGVELDKYVKENLVSELATLPFAFSILCYVESEPAGLVNCFTVFSTFKCKPVVNVHDFVVRDRFRGNGLSQLLLGEVERVAQEKGACKITLEVLDKNHVAKNAYAKFGFVGYELDPQYGKAMFMEKALT